MGNTKTIGKSEYEVTPIIATAGYKLGRKIATIISSYDAIEKFIEIDGDLSMTYELMSCVLQDGKSITKANFNECFENKWSEIPGVLAYVIEVNFADFLLSIKTDIVDKAKPLLEKLG